MVDLNAYESEGLLDGGFFERNPPESTPYLFIMPLQTDTGKYGVSHYNTTWYGNAISLGQCESMAEDATRYNQEALSVLRTRQRLLKWLPYGWIVFLIIDAYFWYGFAHSSGSNGLGVSTPVIITVLVVLLGACGFKFINWYTQKRLRDALKSLEQLVERESKRLAGRGGYWQIGTHGRWLAFHVTNQHDIPNNPYTAVDVDGNPVVARNEYGRYPQENENYYNPNYFPDSNYAQASAPFGREPDVYSERGSPTRNDSIQGQWRRY
mmetsp:Transcript_933/g.986  ORF Transcript_933/g.986 Transcript_933/m.986 type:complete len:266 (+) Transcript_933:26-823(+)